MGGAAGGGPERGAPCRVRGPAAMAREARLRLGQTAGPRGARGQTPAETRRGLPIKVMAPEGHDAHDDLPFRPPTHRLPGPAPWRVVDDSQRPPMATPSEASPREVRPGSLSAPPKLAIKPARVASPLRRCADNAGSLREGRRGAARGVRSSEPAGHWQGGRARRGAGAPGPCDGARRRCPGVHPWPH